MSAAILSAIRQHSQLTGNTFFLALELAHRLNAQGYGRVSYQFLAWKAHCSKRTAQRQIARLIDEHHLFRKTVIRTKYGNAWNLYQYIGPRVSGAAPPVTTRGDSMPSTLPAAGREKELSLTHALENQRKALHFLSPGSPVWERTQEEIARLEALRRC